MESIKSNLNYLKLFSLFLMLGTILISCVKNKNNNDEKILTNDGYEIGRLINGEKTGIWKFFNNDNILVKVSNYNNGKLDGVTTSYYLTGSVYSVGYYKNGIPSGNMSVFYEDGKLNFSDNYHNGKKEGISYFYSKEDGIEMKSNYENGLKEGKQIHLKGMDTLKIDFFEKGKLIKTIEK
ncbi:hypothetical protein [Flavobacterium sp. WV_118_3]|uniref:toxin-antitoxin system YwqK family antitoxin n=1 Tax=Flavobacterium sp. WV_118_3 TaxID=3151764 RepID=UPI00321A4D96